MSTCSCNDASVVKISRQRYDALVKTAIAAQGMVTVIIRDEAVDALLDSLATLNKIEA